MRRIYTCICELNKIDLTYLLIILRCHDDQLMFTVSVFKYVCQKYSDIFCMEFVDMYMLYFNFSTIILYRSLEVSHLYDICLFNVSNNDFSQLIIFLYEMYKLDYFRRFLNNFITLQSLQRSQNMNTFDLIEFITGRVVKL